MTSACLGNFGAYKLFYWNESKRQFDFDKAEKRLNDEILLSQFTKDKNLNLSSENLEENEADGKEETLNDHDGDIKNRPNEIVWVRKPLDTRDPRHLVPTPKEKLYTPRPWPEPRSFYVPPLASPSLAKFTRAHEELRPAASNQSTR